MTQGVAAVDLDHPAEIVERGAKFLQLSMGEAALIIGLRILRIDPDQRS
jgi:hypothetical protein